MVTSSTRRALRCLLAILELVLPAPLATLAAAPFSTLAAAEPSDEPATAKPAAESASSEPPAEPTTAKPAAEPASSEPAAEHTGQRFRHERTAAIGGRFTAPFPLFATADADLQPGDDLLRHGLQLAAAGLDGGVDQGPWDPSYTADGYLIFTGANFLAMDTISDIGGVRVAPGLSAWAYPTAVSNLEYFIALDNAAGSKL
ncbi:hypothetical protein T492DRAFT_878926, partial [Pavlovales sp. CCMP2436]